MKIKRIDRFWMLIIVFIALFSSCKKTLKQEGRTISSFNSGWKFIKDTTSEDFTSINYIDDSWTDITLPHTTQIEPLVVNNQWQGTAWYRKSFNVDENNKGKIVFLRFEGAMQVADVWINEVHKIQHLGGYLPFIIDITNDIIWGKANIIAIKLNNDDNQQVPPGKTIKTLDFNIYGGIYRNVELIITDPLHITDPILANKTGGGGIFIRFDSVSSEMAEGKVKTHVQNDDVKEVNAAVVYILIDDEGDTIVTSKSNEILIPSGTDVEFNNSIVIDDPVLWSPDHPYLYTLKTILYNDGKVVDDMETMTGIRNIELNAEEFKLNGERMFIWGTNRHHEYPYVGYAISDEAQYRDAVKIKNAGFDFVRLSHYPQCEAFLDACDELGLIVMNCIPGWQFMGDTIFSANSLQNCRDMIRRDRNHPSVMFWEVSINETSMNEGYMRMANQILDEELSPSAISAGWIDFEAYDLFIPARQHANPPDYWNQYKINERPVFIAEYGDWEYYAQNAGFNQTAYNDLEPEERTSRQLRGDGEARLLQQALNNQEASNSNLKGASTIGHANWLMFDYNRGYADDIEASGISDMFRISKFSFYFFQSQRSPDVILSEGLESGPMIFITSYWQPTSSTDVRVFSNCSEVELFLNGRSLGRREPDKNYMTTNLPHPPFTFNIENFEPGELEAVAFIKGAEKARHKVKTPGKPSSIQLNYDLSGKAVSKTGLDYIFVYASVIDENGTICPLNGNTIHFEAEGKCQIIGPTNVSAEAGIATILLQTFADTGNIKIVASGEGLSKTEIFIER